MQIATELPVEIALRTLDEDDRRRVTALIQALENWENDQSLRDRSQRLDTADDIYVLKTSTDLRIFFRVLLDRGKIVVLDIANKKTILASGSI